MLLNALQAHPHRDFAIGKAIWDNPYGRPDTSGAILLGDSRLPFHLAYGGLQIRIERAIDATGPRGNSCDLTMVSCPRASIFRKHSR